MNEGNLKPVRTASEARRRGRKGGLKSGQKRRERKALKEHLLLLLSKGDTQEKMCLALIERATQGDLRAFEIIRDTIGEKPVNNAAETNDNVQVPIIQIVPVDPKHEDEDNDNAEAKAAPLAW